MRGVPWHTCGSQKTNCSCWFSPSTGWVPGVKTGFSGWADVMQSEPLLPSMFLFLLDPSNISSCMHVCVNGCVWMHACTHSSCMWRLEDNLRCQCLTLFEACLSFFASVCTQPASPKAPRNTAVPTVSLAIGITDVLYGFLIMQILKI